MIIIKKIIFIGLSLVLLTTTCIYIITPALIFSSLQASGPAIFAALYTAKQITEYWFGQSEKLTENSKTDPDTTKKLEAGLEQGVGGLFNAGAKIFANAIGVDSRTPTGIFAAAAVESAATELKNYVTDTIKKSKIDPNNTKATDTESKIKPEILAESKVEAKVEASKASTVESKIDAKLEINLTEGKVETVEKAAVKLEDSEKKSDTIGLKPSTEPNVDLSTEPKHIAKPIKDKVKVMANPKLEMDKTKLTIEESVPLEVKESDAPPSAVKNYTLIGQALNSSHNKTYSRVLSQRVTADAYIGKVYIATFANKEVVKENDNSPKLNL